MTINNNRDSRNYNRICFNDLPLNVMLAFGLKYIFFFFAVLGFELRAYTLSHSKDMVIKSLGKYI
jgi:hypothetical protein